MEKKDFSGYDAVFHVAGIAHRKETRKNARLYYEVNRNLAVNTAKKSKEDGVKQFVLISTMNVYGKLEGMITEHTVPEPKTHYGKSKLQAETAVRSLQDDMFRAAILRPPMVYGKGCRGNYPKLAKAAKILPVFPGIKNRRSMIYIENLCDFAERVIREGEGGIFYPQNEVYVCTEDLMRKIAEYHRHRILFFPGLGGFLVKAAGRTGKKVFGSLAYDIEKDRCRRYGFEESVERTERQECYADIPKVQA